MSNTLLVTCTSGRPAVMPILTKWMEAQTTDNFDWLIVSDDWDNYKFPKIAKVIKRDNSEDTLPSLNHNMLAALDYLDKETKYEKILFIEDDDYYHSDYVKQLLTLLNKSDLVGFNEDAYYYVIARKAKMWHNQNLASLAATGLNRSVLPWLRECCSLGDVFIDKTMWTGQTVTVLQQQPSLTQKDGRFLTGPPIAVTQVVKEFKGRKLLAHNFTGLTQNEKPSYDKNGQIKNYYPRHVGMKQNFHLGKVGLSELGHNSETGGAPDIFGRKLKGWIGEENAEVYLRYTASVAPSDDPAKQEGRRYPAHTMLPLPSDTF